MAKGTLAVIGWKYWRELNLAVGSQMDITYCYLWFSMGFLYNYNHVYMTKKFWQTIKLFWWLQMTARFNYLSNFQLYGNSFM